jgi:hypothetical protein
VYALAEPLVLGADEELVVELRQRSTLGDANIGRFRLSATDQPGETVRSVQAAPLEELAAAKVSDVAEIEAKLRARLLEQFLEEHPPYHEAKGALDRANRQLDEVKKAAGKVNTMVLAERKEPRDTFVLVRGVWDKHGDKVERGILPAIAAWPANEEESRLGLARWVVSRENPLTARVVVNHLWQMLFGVGLVRTPEDFGLQGERPTHPELLDWLAVEFMESGWDVKHLLTVIATSTTYRQDSAVSEALLARDPQNRLLARGPRFRLPSWMLRDSALRASGLLNPALGGPPVKPYQPEGVWEEMFMGRFKYEPSEGAAQYRRTLYASHVRSAQCPHQHAAPGAHAAQRRDLPRSLAFTRRSDAPTTRRSEGTAAISRPQRAFPRRHRPRTRRAPARTRPRAHALPRPSRRRGKVSPTRPDRTRCETQCCRTRRAHSRRQPRAQPR